MSKLNKDDYKSEQAKELEAKLAAQLAEDKEVAYAKAAIERIPENRRFYVFRLLSQEYGTK